MWAMIRSPDRSNDLREVFRKKKKSLFGLMRWENVEKKMQMMLSQGQLSCSQLLLHTSVGLSSAKQVT